MNNSKSFSRRILSPFESVSLHDRQNHWRWLTKLSQYDSVSLHDRHNHWRWRTKLSPLESVSLHDRHNHWRWRTKLSPFESVSLHDRHNHWRWRTKFAKTMNVQICLWYSFHTCINIVTAVWISVGRHYAYLDYTLKIHMKCVCGKVLSFQYLIDKPQYLIDTVQTVQCLILPV